MERGRESLTKMELEGGRDLMDFLVLMKIFWKKVMGKEENGGRRRFRA